MRDSGKVELGGPLEIIGPADMGVFENNPAMNGWTSFRSQQGALAGAKLFHLFDDEVLGGRKNYFFLIGISG